MVKALLDICKSQDLFSFRCPPLFHFSLSLLPDKRGLKTIDASSLTYRMRGACICLHSVRPTFLLIASQHCTAATNLSTHSCYVHNALWTVHIAHIHGHHKLHSTVPIKACLAHWNMPQIKHSTGPYFNIGNLIRPSGHFKMAISRKGKKIQ